MKKIMLPLFFVASFFFLSTSITAQLLMEENFDYTADSALTTFGWAPHSMGGINPIFITSGSLTYPGYISSGVGNSVTYTGGSGSREDLNKSFTGQTSGAVYVSFMVQVISASTDDYFFHFRMDTSVSYLRGRVFIKDEGAGKFNFGLSKGSTSTISYSTTSYDYNTTYLLVLKYEFVDGDDNDLMKLFINPAITGSEPATADLVTTDSNNDIRVDQVCLRQGSRDYSVQLDGIRVSNIWENTIIPVELTSFTASTAGNVVNLKWSTATETNNRGFEVQRKTSGEFSNLGFVKGNGTILQRQTYSFSDANLTEGKYIYRLKQVDYNGTFRYSKQVEVNIAPAEYALYQNYPNPFNPTTSINFNLAVDSKVSLKVYNMLGQEVSLLINNSLNAGQHNYIFNFSNLNSGVYVYKLHADGKDGSIYSESRKMVLMK